MEGVLLAIESPSLTITVLGVLAVQAVLVLIAAHRMDASRVLLGYGAILGAMIVLAGDRWAGNDVFLPFIVVAATLVAVAAWLLAGRRISGPLRVLNDPRPRLETVPLGILALLGLLGITVESVQSIVATYTHPEGNRIELSTSTWAAHLAVLALVIGVSIWIGLRSDDASPDSPHTLTRLLAWVPLLFGALIVAAVTSMVTRDLVEATWPWMVVGMTIVVASALWRPDHSFLQRIRTTFSLGGPILLGLTVLVNLPAAVDDIPDGQLLGQVIVFTGLGLALGMLAIRTRTSNDLYAMATLLALGCWFGTRYADAGDQAAMLSFIALAWVLAGTGVIARGRGTYAFASPPLTISSLATSAVSLPAALAASGNVDDVSSSALRVLAIIWLLSLAGLLALAAWLYRRRDLAFWASGLAMLALLLQIESRSPDNIHTYTVPIAAWLFALGLIERNRSSRANGLFAAGSAFLVLPGLWMAQTTGEFRWLATVLVEGIALLMAGLLLRLRIPVAAGVATLSVLVLRMLIDVVNAMPNWVALLTAGLVLLAGGTVWISFRDDLQRWRQRFNARWGRLR